jgi:tetratricopeptide (TPR) repeat protein
MDAEIESFRSHVIATGDELRAAKSFGAVVAKRISSGMSIRKDKKRFQADLDLVDQEIQAAEAADASAVYEAEYEGSSVEVSADLLRAAAKARRGDIELLSDSPKAAIRLYESALAEFEAGDVYLRLGVALEIISQPGRALAAFDRAAELEPESADGIEALREANRLRSRMFLGGWFVGSNKILLGLLVLTALFVWVGLNSPGFFFWAVVFGAGAGSYWFAKFRRPTAPRRSAGMGN